MVAAHEIEHNMNLYHSQAMGCFDGSGHQAVLTSSNDCLYQSYGDQYTTMGSAGDSDHTLLDAERLRSLGWLDPSELQTVTSVGAYTIVPTYSGLTGLRELRIAAPNPVDTGYPGAWTIELRSTLSGSAFDQFSGSSLSALPASRFDTRRMTAVDSDTAICSIRWLTASAFRITPARPAASGMRLSSPAAP
jgi:hypothetical protein